MLNIDSVQDDREAVLGKENASEPLDATQSTASPDGATTDASADDVTYVSHNPKILKPCVPTQFEVLLCKGLQEMLHNNQSMTTSLADMSPEDLAYKLSSSIGTGGEEALLDLLDIMHTPKVSHDTGLARSYP